MRLFCDYSQTLHSIGIRLREKSLSCVQLVEECRNRYQRFEPQVHAWELADWGAAFEQAKHLDERLAQGESVGALHGIPFGIKDIIDVDRWPTKAGAGFWKNYRPEKNATVVDRLIEAGAILVGKTVTTQHACFDPPITRNPWNADHTPGGSSSGSAAAVSSGMCLAALGSQTGGSIIRPSAYCGIAGLKPTYHSVPIDGVRYVSPALDHVGPIARCCSDLALVQSVLTSNSETRQKLTELTQVPIEDFSAPTLVQDTHFFSAYIHAELAIELRDAVDQWKDAGMRIIDKELPKEFTTEVLEHHRTIMAAECAAVHRVYFLLNKEDYKPNVRSLIEYGLTITEEQLQAAKQWQREWSKKLNDWLVDSACDGLLLPATTGPAPDCLTTGDPRFNSPWSLTGLVEVSFPLGLSTRELPLCAQIVGPHHREDRVLAAASWCEFQQAQRSVSEDYAQMN